MLGGVGRIARFIHFGDQYHVVQTRDRHCRQAQFGIQYRQLVLALLQLLERLGQMAQQHGTRQRQHGGHEHEVDGDDGGLEEGVIGDALDLQLGVGVEAQHHHHRAGQRQGSQCRTQTQ